jgi:hypothetical protein
MCKDFFKLIIIFALLINYLNSINSIFEGFENLNNTKYPSTSWELHKGYESKDPYAYPHRVSGSGENGGLKFEIWRKVEEVKRSNMLIKGFKLAIHLPNEPPNFDKLYFRFPLEKSATLVLSPRMTVFVNIFLIVFFMV